MSRSLSAKTNQVPAKNENPIGCPVVRSLSPAVQPPVRDVTQSLALLSDSQNVIATYKDLNQPMHDQIAFQKKQFAFAIAFLILATTLLLAYHQVTKPRAMHGQNQSDVIKSN